MLQGLTGAVTIDTLGGDFPMLAGNVVAIALSAIVCIVVSMIKPQVGQYWNQHECCLAESKHACMGIWADTVGVAGYAGWSATTRLCVPA